jgi:hypothetical protein
VFDDLPPENSNSCARSNRSENEAGHRKTETRHDKSGAGGRNETQQRRGLSERSSYSDGVPAGENCRTRGGGGELSERKCKRHVRTHGEPRPWHRNQRAEHRNKKTNPLGRRRTTREKTVTGHSPAAHCARCLSEKWQRVTLSRRRRRTGTRRRRGLLGRQLLSRRESCRKKTREHRRLTHDENTGGGAIRDEKTGEAKETQHTKKHGTH